MAGENVHDNRSGRANLSDNQGDIDLLKNQISHLKSELSIHKEKLNVWNEIAEEGLFIHENFIIKEVNQALIKLTGYTRHELIGQHGKNLITEDSYEKLKQHIASGYTELFELEMIKKNGDKITVNTKGKAIQVGSTIQRAVIVHNISDFKKTQISLEKSEERHRLISRLLSDYVYTCKIKPNESPRIGWVSGSIESVSGFKIKEIEQFENGWFSIIHPEDVEKVANSVYSNYKDNEFYQNEYRITDKDGKTRWLHDKSMCIGFDEETNELTLLGATKDVTERKLIEEDLKKKNYDYEILNKNLEAKNNELSSLNQKLYESENKYKLLIENSSMGVGISQGEKILFANQSILDIYGVKTFEELSSRKLTDYMTLESKKMVQKRYQKYQKNIPQDNIFRYEIIRPDGNIRTVEIISSEILFEGKTCRQALINDITSEIETENALMQAANIFKNIQIGLLIYRLDDLKDDRSLRMMAVNPAATQLIGIAESQMIGHYIDDIFPNLRIKKIPQQYAEVVRTQIPIAFDDINYEDDRVSEGIFSVKVFPLPDQCVGISFENVSIRRKAEKDLLTRNQELNNFVYKVSHDLRAPLSSIKGLINLSRLEENKMNHLPKIEERVDHLDGFIRDILSHSRNLNTAVIIEEIDLKQIIYDSIDELKYLSYSSDINKDISISGGALFSDKIRVVEICRNLVSNAIKYHDKNKEDKFLKVTINITKKSATIIFKDNGIGIEEEYLEKIFKMFFRATEESEGSGIGLYIVHQALEKIHGKVSVKSMPNIGSTFTVKIPNLITQKKV